MPSLVSQSSGESSGPLVNNGCSIIHAFSSARVLRKVGDEVPAVVVGERYELMRKIGSGGYGTVYEAHDRDFGRRVAVKVLALGDRDVALREGQVLAQLHHPNVVAIYDHGIGPDFQYFVMELLPGATLREWWGGKTPAPIIGLFMQAGSGLAAAHAVDLVHRDFKPSNVRIGADGRAVVVDFGLARHIDTLERDAEQIGRFQGTVDYAPPERLCGDPGDERADQFSFCVALWEALSGVNPFGPCTPETTPQERLRALAAGVAGTPRGSRRVVRAVRQGLSLQPADRFPSMHALLAALGPKRSRWTWREVLMVGVAVAVVTSVLTRAMPAEEHSRVGALSAATNAQASWFGPVAVAYAREGYTDAAIYQLKLAQLLEPSKAASQLLAESSKIVALEFESRGLSSDAATVWVLTVLFARDAGDAELENHAHVQTHSADCAATPVPR